MDIEKLTKSQIVLLTLLISFVTSIATGIVTVSLMEQAPPVFAQTVNRVIEHTVEKVATAPAEGQGAAAASIVTTEKTVVVKESELVAEAVERVRPSVVHIYTGASESAVILGLGLVLDDKGTILVDASSLGEIKEPGVSFAEGRVRASIAGRNLDAGTATLKLSTTTIDGKAISFKPVTLAVGPTTLGQTVVALSGKTIPRIADGLVSAIVPAGEGAAVIDTNISAELLTSGSPLINTDGAVMGVSTSISRASSLGGFISSSALVAKSDASPQ